jgi:hypothetical protein
MRFSPLGEEAGYSECAISRRSGVFSLQVLWKDWIDEFAMQQRLGISAH